MKLEVGMYVRYEYEKNVYIGKIKFISEVMCGLNETLQINIDNCMEEILKKDILEASHNIEELLKKGDYVNGYMITDFSNECYDEELDDYVEGFSIVLGNEEQMYSIPPKDIETVLTKEQFESMAYKVVEE